ncbi:MAG: hypothetical protein KF901_04705 [Myxococcales bacterium]|nr:hypothetical protein [Myxococcales bacterium]
MSDPSTANESIIITDFRATELSALMMRLYSATLCILASYVIAVNFSSMPTLITQAALVGLVCAPLLPMALFIYIKSLEFVCFELRASRDGTVLLHQCLGRFSTMRVERIGSGRPVKLSDVNTRRAAWIWQVRVGKVVVVQTVSSNSAAIWSRRIDDFLLRSAYETTDGRLIHSGDDERA